MLVFLQCTVLCLLCLVAFVGVVASWQGLAPELDVLSYLTSAGTFIPILTVMAFLASLTAYILGWNPTQKILKRFRTAIVLPAFTSIVTLCGTAASLLGLLAIAYTFALSFDRPVVPEIIGHLFVEDYAQTDRTIAGSKLPSDRIADLTLINDSLRQVHFKTTGDPDPDICRTYLSYFSVRRRAFQPVWWRYLYGHAEAACLEVTGDLNAALAVHHENVRLAARWMTVDEVRRAKRRIAAIYFRASENQTDIGSKSERLQKILTILATDPDIAATRMRGAAQYLLGNYAEAVRIWRALMASIPRSDLMERKKLLNNSALAYGALNQHELAIRMAREGLEIDFQPTHEAERREQIRLLTTMAALKVNVAECANAYAVWNKRGQLTQQELSPCSALIEAQIMSCSPLPNEQERIINLLLLGTGLTPTAVFEPAAEALTKLLDQSRRKFSQCYIGLEFDIELVKQAITPIRESRSSP